MGVNISDLAGLSEPLKKLIETVSAAIGKVYEPCHIKRMAKAKVEELELISGAINNNLQLPTRYESENVIIDSTNANELVQRAQNRFLFQEMKKQQNIDSVVNIAYSEMENVISVNNTPVDSDWIGAFFDSVANVSTEQMQLLWGKILSGEVQKPGSFSLRVLDTVRKISSSEASTFKKIAPYILKCKGDKEGICDDCFLIENDDESLLKRHNVTYSDIMLLHEAGLISDNLIKIGIEIEPSETELIKNFETAIELKNEGKHTIVLHHFAYFLTESGKEILPIVYGQDHQEGAKQYLESCFKEIKDTILTEDSDTLTIRIVKLTSEK